MSLSSSYAIISSAFTSTASQSSTIASNITNAGTPGYVREIANQITDNYGGADVVSISHQANTALLDQMNASTSESSSQNIISTALATLAQSVSDSSNASSATGALQNGNSPEAMLGNLQSLLATYESSPSNTAAATAVVTASQNLAASLNTGAQAVDTAQEQADQGMASAVSTINGLLSQFQTANNTIVSGLQTGANISKAEDQRDSLLTQLSQQVGISTTTNTNGSMSIYTDSGVTLFQDTPSVVAFTPTTTYVAGVTGNAVTVNGIPLTGAGAPMAVQTGALAGYAQIRDTIAPEYGAQLDQIAGGLISAFAESDQSSTPTLPDLPGLFTTAGLTSVPSPTASAGLAGQIEVNPSVVAADGGDVTLLRDGGVSGSGNAAYVYNATGSAGYTGRIEDMVSALTTSMAFDPSAGLGASASLTQYASSSVNWLQATNQSASDSASYQTSLASQASTALSNATGVNLDTEMTNMLNIENSYTSSAKLLTTVTAMFNALLQAA